MKAIIVYLSVAHKTEIEISMHNNAINFIQVTGTKYVLGVT